MDRIWGSESGGVQHFRRFFLCLFVWVFFVFLKFFYSYNETNAISLIYKYYFINNGSKLFLTVFFCLSFPFLLSQSSHLQPVFGVAALAQVTCRVKWLIFCI